MTIGYNILIPGNAVGGDVVLVMLLGANANTPIGWTTTTGSVLGIPWQIWRKTLILADAGTVILFPITSSQLVTACVLHIQNTTGVDVVGSVSTTPNVLATSLAARSITPTGSTDLLLGFWIVAKAGVNIILPTSFISVGNVNGIRNTQCVNGHIQAANDWVANNNLCPIDNAAKSGITSGAPSIAIGFKALTSNANTGNQTATWTGGAAAMAVQIALAGTIPVINFNAITSQ